MKKFILFVFLLGCMGAPMAKLSVSKPSYGQLPNYCKTQLTMTNLFPSRTIRPVVTLLAYDSAGNTLDQPTTYFDVIQPGKLQTKDALINADCYRIAKVHVYSAYDPDMELSGYWKGHYFPLKGVHDITFNFTP